MGLKSRSAAKEKRKKAKRAAKAAKQAQYEAWTKAGQNSKTVRARRQFQKKKTVADISHPEGRCGNVGCDPCQGRRRCPRPVDSCHCGRFQKA